MNLNPVVVIPTYWCGRRTAHSVDRGPLYDHMTPIDKQGELPRCLTTSLAALIAFSRVYLCVHNPSDVIAGAAFGVLVALVVVFFVKKFIAYRNADKQQTV